MGPPPSNEPPKYVILRAVGGEIGAASALAPKIGPLGLVRETSNFVPIADHRSFMATCSRSCTHARRLHRAAPRQSTQHIGT